MQDIQDLHAASLTADVHDWLANSLHPRILHVFVRACNLINERRQVLSIVSPQIGNGPFSLVLEDDVCFSDHLNLESRVSSSTDQLNLGGLTTHTNNAKFWSPRPDWRSLHTKRNSILNHLMLLRATLSEGQGERSNRLNNWEIASGGLSMQSASTTALATTSPVTKYQSLTSSLSSAIVTSNIPSALTLTSKLAGFGIGLTPAGDDFIMGAIYAAWIIHPSEVVSFLAQEIASTAAPLTTSLSAAWLRSAGKGEAAILWHEFFDALVSGNADAIGLQIARLLSVGHSSGADALAGFMGTFFSWAELSGSKTS